MNKFLCDTYHGSELYKSIEFRTNHFNMTQLRRKLSAVRYALQYAKEHNNKEDILFFKDGINHILYYIQEENYEITQDI